MLPTICNDIPLKFVANSLPPAAASTWPGPGTGRCGLCGSASLSILPVRPAGVWISCQICNTGWDTISYIAAVKNQDLPTTTLELAKHRPQLYAKLGLRTSELEQFVSRVAEFKQLAASAHMRLKQADSADMQAVAALLDRQPVPAQPLCGLVDVGMLRRVWVRPRVNLPKKSTTVAVPLWLAPGLPGGLLLLNQSDNSWQVLAFDRHDTDCGVAGADILYTPPRRLCYLVNEPRSWLVQQLRWLSTGQTVLLPMVLALSRTPHQTVGFWDYWGRESLVCLTSAADADVSSAVVTAALLDSQLCNQTNFDVPYSLSLGAWVDHLAKTARPWAEATYGILRGSRRDDDILQAMRRAGLDTAEFAAQAPVDLRTRLLASPHIAAAVRTVEFGGRQVREDGNRWLTDTGAIICDFRLVIERVLRSDYAGVYYSGVVIYNGQHFEFTAAADQIDADALGFARNLVRDAGGGLPTYDPAWTKQAVHVASRLHTPQPVAGCDRIGWDAAHSRIQLAEFSVDAVGGLSATGSWVPLPNLPTRGLSPQVVPGSRTITVMSESSVEASTGWGALLLMLYNVLAPRNGGTPQQIWLSRSDLYVDSVFATCGCPRNAGKLRDWPHNWPVLTRRRDSCNPWYVVSGSRGDYGQLLCADRGGFWLDVPDEWQTFMRISPVTPGSLFMPMLVALMSQRFSGFDELVDLAAAQFAKFGGARAAVLHAARRIVRGPQLLDVCWQSLSQTNAVDSPMLFGRFTAKVFYENHGRRFLAESADAGLLPWRTTDGV